MNRAQLRAYARRLLSEQDPSTSYWTDEDLNDFLNRAYEQFVADTEILQCTSVTPSVAGVPTYAIPSDTLYILRVYYQGRPGELEKLSWEDLDRLDPGWATAVCPPGQTPRAWTPRGQYIHLYPAPAEDGREITVWEVQAPCPMGADTDEPAIATGYREAIAIGAALRALEADRRAPEFTVAYDRLAALYDRLVQNARRQSFRRESTRWRLRHVRDLVQPVPI